MMLIVATVSASWGIRRSRRRLRQIIAKYPDREEAKDAQYQRLINFTQQRTDAPAELEEYLKSNPAPERADQAKLLKAEHFYKEQKFAEAAPIYAELRTSNLSPKLRAESAYKLGWCFCPVKGRDAGLEAFGSFVKDFPDSPQIPSASDPARASLTRRARTTMPRLRI